MLDSPLTLFLFTTDTKSSICLQAYSVPGSCPLDTRISPNLSSLHEWSEVKWRWSKPLGNPRARATGDKEKATRAIWESRGVLLPKVKSIHIQCAISGLTVTTRGPAAATFPLIPSVKLLFQFDWSAEWCGEGRKWKMLCPGWELLKVLTV